MADKLTLLEHHTRIKQFYTNTHSLKLDFLGISETLINPKIVKYISMHAVSGYIVQSKYSVVYVFCFLLHFLLFVADAVVAVYKTPSQEPQHREDFLKCTSI